MVNENTQSKIDEIRTDLLQQLQDLQGAPGGPIMYEVPPLYERLYDVEEDNDDDDDKEEGDGNQDEGMGKRESNNSEGDSQGGSTSAPNSSIKKRRKFKKKERKLHGSELYDQVD